MAVAYTLAATVHVVTPEPLGATDPQPETVVPLSVNATVPVVTAEPPTVSTVAV
jgi:hypothetical protein